MFYWLKGTINSSRTNPLFPCSTILYHCESYFTKQFRSWLIFTPLLSQVVQVAAKYLLVLRQTQRTHLLILR